MAEKAILKPEGAPSHAKNSGDRGNKLLADAQRAAKGLSGQMLVQLLPEGKEESWDATIRRLESQVVEMQQVLVANRVIKLDSHKGWQRTVRGEVCSMHRCTSGYPKRKMSRILPH